MLHKALPLLQSLAWAIATHVWLLGYVQVLCLSSPPYPFTSLDVHYAWYLTSLDPTKSPWQYVFFICNCMRYEVSLGERTGCASGNPHQNIPCPLELLQVLRGFILSNL